MARSKGYSVDSVSRALTHHLISGAVLSFAHNARATIAWKWRVVVYDAPVDYYDLTLGEAHALCVGLAAAEHKYGGKD